MAYVPQFIPTNTQVLQGTLDQYQKASDTETSRLNQVNDLYSALPTTNPYDTSQKNKIMGEFQKNVIAGLDKKYNFDRSNTQYAKELASEIGKLRGNPLWTLVKEREQLDALRQKTMADKGSDYYENVNPDTLTDVNALKSWKPMDLKDMERQVATLGKEHATSMRQQSLSRPAPGILQFTNQEGFKDIESATNWLMGEQGQAWLDQSIQGTGFEGHMNDPLVKSRAIGAALGQLVGKPDIQRMGDPSWEEAARAARAKKQTESTPFQKRTNMGINNPSPISSVYDLQNTNARLSEIDAIPDQQKTPEQMAERDNLQRQKDRVANTYSEVISNPNGQKSIQRGQMILQNKVSDSSVDKSKLFKELEDYFVNTGSLTRNERVFDFADLSTIYSESMGQLANTQGKGVETTVANTFKEMAGIITRKIGANPEAEKQVLEAIREWDKYYRGVGNYRNDGYKKNIEKPINDKLKEGVNMVADIYDPPMSVDSPDYKKYVDTTVRNLTAFDISVAPPNSGSFKPVSTKDATKLYTKLREGQGSLAISVAMERESEPRILLKQPDGSTVQLTMNPQKMGPDTANEFAGMSGLPQFRDVFYKDINLEPRNYTLRDNKDKTLYNIISKRYGDTSPFSGLEINKVQSPSGEYMYIVKSDALSQLGYPQGYPAVAKADMIETLDDIYMEYKNTKQ